MRAVQTTKLWVVAALLIAPATVPASNLRAAASAVGARRRSGIGGQTAAYRVQSARDAR